MKTLFPETQNQLFLATLVLLIGYTSCKKKELTYTSPANDVTKLTDSCSYTLDGVAYFCNQAYSSSKGNRGANLDTTAGGWKWDADTLLYNVSYSIGAQANSAGPGGDLTLTIIKKIAKTQLTRNMGGILGPVSDTLLYYPKGERGYAVDYCRFNSQNGVALEIKRRNMASIPESIITYSKEMVHLPTAITNASQKDAKFEIINVYFFPAYAFWLDSHIIEARFNAVLFDANEKAHHLENGYIRIHID